MRLKKILLISVLVLFATDFSQANSAKTINIALITDKTSNLDKSPLISLLETELSQKEGIRLLERAAIEKIFDEQKLSATGLLDRNATIKIGKLLRADAFIILSLENKSPDANDLIRTRVSETAHGLRLLDYFEQSDNANPKESVNKIVQKLQSVLNKIAQPDEKLIPVGIVDIHRVQLGEQYKMLERTLPTMLSVRLSLEPKIIMLEREDLKILFDEKLRTEGEDSKFWNSAVLVEGYLQPNSGRLEMHLNLKQAAGTELKSLTIPLEPNEPAAAIAKATTEIILQLQNSPPIAKWQPELEAEQFYKQGQMLYNHKKYEEAMQILETAHTLQMTNVFYTGTLFINEWEVRSNTKSNVYYSNLELAELVSTLVRQIDIGYDKGLLSETYVILILGKPLGFETDHSGYLCGYFACKVSTENETISKINEVSRKIWLNTIKKAAEKWVGLAPPRESIFIRSAWLSSTSPEIVLNNIKESFAKFLMPPDMGGEQKDPGKRLRLACEVISYPSLDFLNGGKRQLSHKTYFKDAEEKLRELWIQYLLELTENQDSIVRFAVNTTLVYYYQQDSIKAQHYCMKALEILQKEIEDIKEACGDTNIREIYLKMNQAFSNSGFSISEQITIFEKIYNPLIESGDAHNLALWDPSSKFNTYTYNNKAFNAGKRWYDLLLRIEKTLNSNKKDSFTVNSLNKVRSILFELKNSYPEFNTSKDMEKVNVQSLLSKKDWSDNTGTFEYIRILLQGNMLWIAFAKPYVGLVCINLQEKKIVSVFHVNAESGQSIYTSYLGQEISGSIRGLAVTNAAGYVAIRNVGIIEFPLGNKTKLNKHDPPLILTEKNSLPSVSITSMELVDNKLWIAYGGAGQESGLVTYDCNNGKINTIFCSTLKGEYPFNAGISYEINSLTLGPDDNLYFTVLYRTGNWDTLNRIAGLWKMNIHSLKLEFIWHDRYTRYFLETIENNEGTFWIRSLEFFSKFDPKSDLASIVLTEIPKEKMDKPIPLIEENTFVLESSATPEFGHLESGHVSLRTATIHHDILWARLGKNQVIIARVLKMLRLLKTTSLKVNRFYNLSVRRMG